MSDAESPKARSFEMGFAEAMHMSVVSLRPEEVRISLVVGPEHLQPQGLVNGGVLAGLVESAGSTGASLNVEDGLVVVGVENHTSFLRPVRSGTLLAIARPIHVGRRSQLWQVDIENDAGKLVATGRLRLMAVERA
jgi:1,4-dihydroxy-2-naphthoyl-CoA hydrolase